MFSFQNIACLQFFVFVSYIPINVFLSWKTRIICLYLLCLIALQVIGSWCLDSLISQDFVRQAGMSCLGWFSDSEITDCWLICQMDTSPTLTGQPLQLQVWRPLLEGVSSLYL